MQRFKEWFREFVSMYAFDFAGWLGEEFGFNVNYTDYSQYYEDMLNQRNQVIKRCNEAFRQREALKVQLRLLSGHATVQTVVSENVDVFLNALAADIHRRNKHWWIDIKTGERLLDQDYADFVVGTKISLIHSEVSEALEGFRKDIYDDKLVDRKMFDVELADAIIRILDLAGAMDVDIGSALKAKLAVNAVRKDHTKEARLATNGKRF